MDIRAYTDKDFAMFNKWRKSHKSINMYSNGLPKLGMIVHNNEQDIAIGFIGRTDTNICILCYPVVNPEAKREDRKAALDYLIKAAIGWFEVSDFEVLYTWSDSPIHIKRLDNNGFHSYSENVTHLFRYKNG